jgi:nicotinate-nucleotide adenylyltransferase
MAAKKIGLFFGSFNPVHTGHMIIANHLVEYTSLEEVWLVVSPHNPLKQKQTLAPDYDRLHLVHLAIGENPHLKASDIEFGLPKPSYTVDTLAYLTEKHPEKSFSLIMGGDNLATLHKWKNYEILLRDYEIYVYQRPDYVPGPLQDHPHVHLLEAPQLHISASFIRQSLAEGRSVQYLVPDPVYFYLEENPIYSK